MRAHHEGVHLAARVSSPSRQARQRQQSHTTPPEGQPKSQNGPSERDFGYISVIVRWDLSACSTPPHPRPLDGLGRINVGPAPIPPERFLSSARLSEGGWEPARSGRLERHRTGAVDAGEAVVAADERHGLAQRRAHHVAALGHAHGAEDETLLHVERLGQRLEGGVDVL